jgi:hypothetical protein|tara:strand:+ start:1074 stop:1877 length:804 start_codon:yes stop_codon:yes gene_type:complete
MQTVSRYLLSQLVIAYISGYHGRNSKVYDRRLTLHRGVSNPVTFTFKNEDQKAQNISSKTYEFNMIDSESKEAVITKTLTILDDGSTVSTTGDASCTITEGDLLPLNAKFYNFSVREVNSDGSREITYADTGYAAAGTVELLDGAYPEFVASINVSTFTASGGPLAYTSGSVDARPGINNNTALHTIAVYTKNFTGALRVQGTMSASPSESDYFDITMEGAGSTANSFSNSTTVTNFNFTGVYHSVRFSWGNSSGNSGVIDKILYRQ